MTDDEKKQAISDIMKMAHKAKDEILKDVKRAMFWKSAKLSAVSIILSLPISLSYFYSREHCWIFLFSFLYGLFFEIIRLRIFKWI